MPNSTLTFQAGDNSSLYVRKWIPDGTSIGKVCIVHGLGEHSGRYGHVAEAFNKEGYTVYAYDQRGHGKSDGKRGDIHAYNQLLDDLEVVINNIQAESSLPFFLYGHSMGGNVVTNFLMERKVDSIKAAIITSPWLTLSFAPPKWQVTLGKVVLKLFPGLVQSNKLNPDELSRDKDIGLAYLRDPLVHDKISPRLYFAIEGAGLRALSSPQKMRIPALIVHGTADPITSPKSSEVLAKTTNCQLKLWDSLLHETHNELNQQEVIDFNVKWVKQFS